MTQKSITLLFVDVETTGLIDNYPDAEITEIAVVSWCEGDKEVLLHERVRPRKGMPPEAAPFNKSYDAKLWASADTWDVHASQAISEMLRGHYICGSNPDFDKRMIAAECFRSGQPRPKWHHRGINTSSLGFPLYLLGEVEQTGLEHLAKYFNVPHEAHTALGDCYAAIGVWEAFFDLYLHRPRLMREALEDLEQRTGPKGDGISSMDDVRTIVLRGLVGE